ncbi:efflux RND transporter periplasmic adaptor subunit [Pseudomaricurvus alkylphenolicus]|nr:efflux RND transporter periplasmic adaptor subunit [Pseudomaricurvus alkylphenolicus]
MEDKAKLLSQLKIDREAPPQQPAGFGKGQVLGLLAVAVLATAGVSYLLMPQTPPSSPMVASVATPPQAEAQRAASTPQPETMAAPARSVATDNTVLNASGYITARRIATVSAQIMGQLQTVLVEEGMKVKQGQVLAQLDASVAEVSLSLAQGRVKVLQAQRQSIVADLAEARRVLKRVSTLGDDNYSSESQRTRASADVDKFQAVLASADSEITVAKLEVDRQSELLDDHTVRAPFGGVVTVKNAQPGEIVSPSSAGGGFTRTGICTIVDMASLEIEVDVNEAYIGRVFAGQQVKANLDAYPDWDIPASVIAIIPTADRAKATVRVRIKIEQMDKKILPDMGVKVAFLSE